VSRGSARASWLGRLKPDLYLVLIFATAGLATLAPVRGAAAEGLGLATKLAIAFVFFMHGARLSREAVVQGLIHWRLHLVVLGVTFGLFPLLCLGLSILPDGVTPPVLAGGLIFLGCIPSTIQSSIGFTAIARGNVAAAVAAASASNLLGVVVTPALTAALLHAEGQVSSAAFQAIAFQLLAPFAAGQVLRRWIAPWVAAKARMLSLADRGSILLVIYVAFSGAVVEGVWRQVGADDLVRLVVLCTVLLAAVLAATWGASRAFGFSREDEIAVVFCGSKKSLASGAPMAAALFPPAGTGLAILPLMLFHQIQLMACAVIAQRYAARDIAPESR
jgi:sodium/bile acid cotransporter 7